MIQEVENHSHHISRQFNIELEEVKTRMLEMGGKVERQLKDAIEALINVDSELARRVRKDDRVIDRLEVSIDEQCSRILARRQPAASDLRLILAIIKTIRDLERIGDESSKIAKMAVRLSREVDLSKGSSEVRHIGEMVCNMVHNALDAFARYDTGSAIAVTSEDEDVDEHYSSSIKVVIEWMQQEPEKIDQFLNLIWALRALERIGDHAKNISEHILYVVRGKDVRHGGLSKAKS
ncbi:MAG: phosphate signaling complex protein PhoU [Gammaproteobacteria bacterium]|nr:phosphate signaling complex protein PhoU [Gammaproteobacteria bacterium]